MRLRCAPRSETGCWMGLRAGPGRRGSGRGEQALSTWAVCRPRCVQAPLCAGPAASTKLAALCSAPAPRPFPPPACAATAAAGVLVKRCWRGGQACSIQSLPQSSGLALGQERHPGRSCSHQMYLTEPAGGSKQGQAGRPSERRGFSSDNSRCSGEAGRLVGEGTAPAARAQAAAKGLREEQGGAAEGTHKLTY